MPKIQWTNLPPALRQHLFDRLEERKINAEDLYKLKLWRDSEPDAPDGLSYKDFGSFKICGFWRGAQELQCLGSFWSIASTNGRDREGLGWGRSAVSCAVEDVIRTTFGFTPLKSCHQLAK